jgi:hypothetical protein
MCCGLNSTIAAAMPPHRQSFLVGQPLGFLAVDHHTLPAQQDMQTAIAELAPLAGQIAQFLAQSSVIVLSGLIMLADSKGIDDTTRAPLARPMECQ